MIVELLLKQKEEVEKMEHKISEISAYLDKYYESFPAFLFGSRANGYQTEKSDWDVGVIGAKELKMEENITFQPINISDLETGVIDLHNTSFSSFAKRIIPLRKKETVREIEKLVKTHIINYVLQNGVRDKNSVSGEEILTSYLNEEIIFGFHKPKYLKFIRSKKDIKNVSEDYEKILAGYRPPKQHHYQSYRKINTLYKTLGVVVDSIEKSVIKHLNSNPTKIIEKLNNKWFSVNYKFRRFRIR
jgi:predicted nucleotidyltransferase